MGGTGSIRLDAGNGGAAVLAESSPRDVDLETQFRLDVEDGTPAGMAIGVVARATEHSRYLVTAEVGPEGVVTLHAYSGDEEIRAVELPDLVVEEGQSYTLRVSVTGAEPTTIKAMFWESEGEAPED